MIRKIVVALAAVGLCASAVQHALVAAPKLAQRQPCDTIREPSGLVQLADGRIVVVDDEKHRPISIRTLADDLTLSSNPLHNQSFFGETSGREITGALDDLEALAIDDEGFVYAITSHSRKKSGKRSADREKLLRFRVAENKIEVAGLLTNLRKSLISIDPSLRAAVKDSDRKNASGFNIEGLAFDRKRKELLIGLRSPVVGSKAVILSMKNPHASFENKTAPRLASDPIYLDLDKGGIRALAFDPKLNGYWVISRQEKEGEEFKLWLWNREAGKAPRRVHSIRNYDLSNAEGITPVRHNGEERIMLAFDSDKKSKGKKGCYLLLSYAELEVGHHSDDERR